MPKLMARRDRDIRAWSNITLLALRVVVPNPIIDRLVCSGSPERSSQQVAHLVEVQRLRQLLAVEHQ